MSEVENTFDNIVDDYIRHTGVQGMHWRQHDSSRRWQTTAVYAQGKPNPDADVRGPYKDNKASRADKKEARRAAKEAKYQNKLSSKVENTKAKLKELDNKYKNAKNPISRKLAMSRSASQINKLGKFVRKHEGAKGERGSKALKYEYLGRLLTKMATQGRTDRSLLMTMGYIYGRRKDKALNRKYGLEKLNSTKGNRSWKNNPYVRKQMNNN